MKWENHSIDYQRENVKSYDFIRWNSGKKVDPRLLALLESFEKIYSEHGELFKKIFPGDHERLFQKIRDAISIKEKRKMKKSMQRNLTFGSSRGMKGRGIEMGMDEFRVEKFKVRTPIVLVEEGSSHAVPNGGSGTNQ